jgi:uncharacterized membrane protein HdeD (DUF308 family)/predicted flap endonuclease-1-like 5' DNA nuclease
MTAQTAQFKSEKATVPWWLVLIEGIAAILIGIFLLISPATTTFVIVQFLGFYWLISGIFSIISIFIDRSMWGWKLLAGVLGIIAGVLIVQHPLWSTLLVPATLVIVLGIEGLIIGVINLIQAFRGGGWGIGILGVLSIIFGLILLANPMLATIGLPFVLGIFGIVFGVIAIFGAFRLRREAKEAEMARQARPVPTRMEAKPAVETMVAKPVETGAGAVSAAGAGVSAVGAGAVAAGATAFAAAESMVEETKEKAPEVTEEVVETVEDVTESAAETVSAEVPGVVSAVSGMAGEAVSEVKKVDLDFGDLDENAKFGYGLEYIEGIGPAFAQKFHEVGITTIRAFFERGVSAKGREELAELTGISGKLILEWINHVDLYRVKGVGSEYADLLEAAGVDTVVELANRNATNLFNKMLAVNEEKKLVRRTPVEAQVLDWVEQAKTLPRKVMY